MFGGRNSLVIDRPAGCSAVRGHLPSSSLAPWASPSGRTWELFVLDAHAPPTETRKGHEAHAGSFILPPTLDAVKGGKFAWPEGRMSHQCEVIRSINRPRNGPVTAQFTQAAAECQL